MLVAELLERLQEMPPTAPCVVLSPMIPVNDAVLNVGTVEYDHGIVRIGQEPFESQQRSFSFDSTDPPVQDPRTDEEHEEDKQRLERIGAMQRDLSFLFTVNWCDVDRAMRIRVLTHALTVLRDGDD